MIGPIGKNLGDFNQLILHLINTVTSMGNGATVDRQDLSGDPIGVIGC